MPGAQVVLTVGGNTQPAVTADADGRYSFDVVTATPGDLITLQANRVGAQANVVLSSLVGDAGATGAVAAVDGTVSAAALPAAKVTNITTAEAVLTAQALGKTPASSADIDAVKGQFSSAQTLQMATAIKLVADGGVRQLGTGTATQSAVGSTTFVEGPDSGLTTALADNCVTGTYPLSGGSLVVTTADGIVLSYTHLFTGPRGEERWMTTRLVDGASTWVWDAAVVKVMPGLAFTQASVPNDYLSYINAGLATGQFYIDPLADGTGSGLTMLGSTFDPYRVNVYAKTN